VCALGPDLAGCGSSSRMPDAMPDASGVPHTITLHVPLEDTLALLAFRDGVDAPWQTPTATAPRRYEIVVHGPYTVDSLCASGATLQQSFTPDDTADVAVACLLGSPQPAGSHVTGSLVQAGTIAIRRTGQIVAAAGLQFDLVVPDGTYDVIARTLSVVAEM